MEKVYNMYGQIGNLRRQRETIRKNHKEILEIKMRVLGNKNILMGLSVHLTREKEKAGEWRLEILSKG